ncbi:MAG: triple tyrosine motif-containing protein, partial [Saprospiraceae bacterium]|nr:triple tyrosine motif-containing protein [Saprospiraceae bacterium]
MSGQQTYPYLHRLETVGGTALDPVFYPVQDERGFVWIPTDYGLVRYDGYELRSFLPGQEDTPTILPERIRQLHIGSSGKIYITSAHQGLSRLDPSTGMFETWLPGTGDTIATWLAQVSDMLEGDDGSWWVVNRGLHHWHPDSASLQSFYPSSILGWQGKRAEAVDMIETLTVDPDDPGVLWLGTVIALLRFDTRTGKLECHSAGDPEVGLVHTPSKICFGNDRKLYVCTWYDGMHIFDTKTNTWEVRYVSGKKVPDALINKVGWIQRKSENELWVLAPRQGLFIYNMGLDQFRLYVPHRNSAGLSPESPYQLRSIAMSLTRTSDGALWIRNPGGFEIVHPQQQQFRKILTRSGVGRVFYRGQQFYLPSTSGRFRIYHDGDGTLDVYPVAEKHGRDAIHAGVFLQNEQLWLLGLNSFYRIEGREVVPVAVRPFDSLQTVPDMHDNSHAGRMLNDSKGNLWVPLKRRGVLKYRPATGHYKIYTLSHVHNGQMYNWEYPGDIVQTETGDIWISFQQGVCYTPDQGATWKYYAFQSTNAQNTQLLGISSLQLDREGRMWMGSRLNGLFYLDTNDPYPQQLNVVTTTDGLASQRILDLELDAQGYLWMITDAGLSKMHPHQLTFEHFGEEYGLYGLTRLTCLPDGRMIAGSSDGFYLFHPDSALQDTSHFVPVIHGFSVFDEPFGSDRLMAQDPGIDLTHRQNFFTFEFSAPNFWAPERVRYQYQLAGVDQGWVNAGSHRTAHYTDIGPGRYEFRVRASNMQGKWNQPAATLALAIAPPWWQTWWAYTLYGLAVLALLAGIYLYQRRRWELKSQLQIEQKEADRLKELDAFKSRFYTNITHEFRTPLTVINGLTDEIKGNDNLRSIIRRNSDRLLTMVNQLLNLSRLESDQLRIQWVQGDIVPFLEYLTESCHSLAQNKQINLSFFARDDHILMDFDESIIEQILINLLSNAIKFTPQYGRVRVIADRAATPEKGMLKITVEDTGCGIPQDKLPHIFDRFYQ